MPSHGFIFGAYLSFGVILLPVNPLFVIASPCRFHFIWITEIHHAERGDMFGNIENAFEDSDFAFPWKDADLNRSQSQIRGSNKHIFNPSAAVLDPEILFWASKG